MVQQMASVLQCHAGGLTGHLPLPGCQGKLALGGVSQEARCYKTALWGGVGQGAGEASGCG